VPPRPECGPRHDSDPGMVEQEFCECARIGERPPIVWPPEEARDIRKGVKRASRR